MPRTRAPYPVEFGASDLGGRPRRCPRRQQRPLGRDLGVSFDERPDHTPLVWAWPAAFLPPQPHGPAKRREVHQPGRAARLRITTRSHSSASSIPTRSTLSGACLHY